MNTEFLPEKGEGGTKEEWWGGEFKYDTIDVL
jgi:hypothetical protein